jgi:putative ABC transport system permease protein
MRFARGRFLTENDNDHSPLAAVINETMARRYWPTEDPIGKRFRVTDRVPYPWITIVGIVAQVRHNAVTEHARAEMYIPHAQWGAAGGSTRRAMTFVLRTAGDPLAVLPRVRDVAQSVDPNLPLAEIRPLEEVASDALSEQRFTTALLSSFALLALVLAAVGLYGVVSLLVARRRREIGIRIALGAGSSSILGMVMTRGVTLAAIGLGAGMAVAAALTRFVATLLYVVTPLDPLTFAAVPVILACVALVASLIPAERAARLNPMLALREE